MQTVNAVRGNARTFLTHLFGAGLDDEDRYVVERFRSMASGEIRRRPGDKALAKGPVTAMNASTSPRNHGPNGGSPMNASNLSAVLKRTELPRLSRRPMKPGSPTAASPNRRALRDFRCRYARTRRRNASANDTSKKRSVGASDRGCCSVMAPT